MLSLAKVEPMAAPRRAEGKAENRSATGGTGGTGGNARFDNAAIRDGSAARWIKISETEH